MSMAAGEYVSVSSQADTESADIAREKKELKADPAAEHEELANIYIERGLDRELADWVARELMVKDALRAHAQDELGISSFTTARPIQAALTSAATFSAGAAMPLAAVLLVPAQSLITGVSVWSLACLAMLGAVGARTGGANYIRAIVRVTFWGAFAMGVTAGIGLLIGKAV
jgi:VIT1/CCC1 family predicted Fe2+/Mn2+ transporter